MDRKPFQFKQFSISDQNSALKLSTDGVLLGAWAKLSDGGPLLDIGTGCGIIALIAAQKTPVQITAIDSDKGSIIDASQNFLQTIWNDRLQAKLISIQEFAQQSEVHFSQIISNPPFFTNSLKSPNDLTNQAKHNDSLTQIELIEAVNKLLLPDGRFFTILPINESLVFLTLLEKKQLFILKHTTVIPREGKKANRVLLEIAKTKNKFTIYNQLTIRYEDGSYTEEYKKLTEDFYLGY